MDSCFDRVGSRQHGVASNEVICWSTDHSIFTYLINTDGDDLRWNSILNPCQLANATCKTLDKGQLEKSRISCRCRNKEIADVETQKLSRRKIMAKPC